MKKSLLFLSRWFPYPADNGSKLRISALLKCLASEYEIHLVSFAEPGEATPEAVTALAPVCGRVQTVPTPHYQPTARKALAAFFSPVPRFVASTRSAELQALLRGLDRDTPYDVIVASQIDMAPYGLIPPARFRVLEELEIGSYTEQLQAASRLPARLRYRLTLLKMSRYIRKVTAGYNLVTAVSEREQLKLRSIVLNSAPLHVIPNGIDPELYQGDFGSPEPNSLVYSGALTYSANLDAMVYFLREIFPRVLAEQPGARLYITGKTGGAESRLPLEHLSPGSVQFTGYLEDVRPRVAQSWVSIVPIRKGGGTRLKILEALALGVPVVSTLKGAEGLTLHHGEEIWLEETPQAFADTIVHLLADPQLQARSGEAGCQAVTARYSWEGIGQRFLQLLSGGAE